MSELIKKTSDLKGLLSLESVKNRFKEILGNKASAFVSSVLNAYSTNDKLQKCDPQSIFSAAVIAATLDLPIDKNLGFSYIIPYGNQAQFQIGYKGFIQLAQRTGLFETINCAEIYEGEMVKGNRFTGGYEFDETCRKSNNITGFYSYFKLLNGFKAELYWTLEQTTAHGQKYSKNFNGLWKTDLIAMGKKTVLKSLLTHYAPLSTEIQRAVTTDQSAINIETGTETITYIDNSEPANIVKDEIIEGKIS